MTDDDPIVTLNEAGDPVTTVDEMNRNLPLAEIERRLRDHGHSQEVIDETLAFVIAAREEWHRRGGRPAPWKKPS